MLSLQLAVLQFCPYFRERDHVPDKKRNCKLQTNYRMLYLYDRFVCLKALQFIKKARIIFDPGFLLYEKTVQRMGV